MPIELFGEVWWEAGTCGTHCSPSKQSSTTHEPRLPDLSSRPAVEQWLDA